MRPDPGRALRCVPRRRGYRNDDTRRRLVEDRRRPASSIRPSCLSQQSESRLDFLLARSFSGQPFVDRGQFVRRRFIVGADEFGFDFERDLPQFLLPVRRPGLDAFQYGPNFVLGQTPFRSRLARFARRPSIQTKTDNSPNRLWPGLTRPPSTGGACLAVFRGCPAQGRAERLGRDCIISVHQALPVDAAHAEVFDLEELLDAVF